MDLEPGLYQKAFDIDLANMMNGKYNVSFIFYYTLIEGRSEPIESMVNSISFEINDEATNSQWDSQAFGPIRFERIRAIEIEKQS